MSRYQPRFQLVEASRPEAIGWGFRKKKKVEPEPEPPRDTELDDRWSQGLNPWDEHYLLPLFREMKKIEPRLKEFAEAHRDWMDAIVRYQDGSQIRTDTAKRLYDMYINEATQLEMSSATGQLVSISWSLFKNVEAVEYDSNNYDKFSAVGRRLFERLAVFVLVAIIAFETPDFSHEVKRGLGPTQGEPRFDLVKLVDDRIAMALKNILGNPWREPKDGDGVYYGDEDEDAYDGVLDLLGFKENKATTDLQELKLLFEAVEDYVTTVDDETFDRAAFDNLYIPRFEDYASDRGDRGGNTYLRGPGPTYDDEDALDAIYAQPVTRR